MTGKAASSWIGIGVTVLALTVGATVYLSRFATTQDVHHELEVHDRTIHTGTQKALDQMREDRIREHDELKQLIREVHSDPR